jgi:hypothetical protein
VPLRSNQFDTAAIEEICNLDDDVYRNKWITYAYAKISERLRKRTGENNATWFTFARWSSYTVGENLRLDKPSAAFDEFLSRNPPLGIWPLRSSLTRLQLDLRKLSDAAMPRTLAIGNRLVFHEIAWATSCFLDWYDALGVPTIDQWKQYRETMYVEAESDLFQPCDPNMFRNGLEAYFLASLESDEQEKARLVLRGNVQLAAYEQWRLEPIVEIALDPLARNLVEFRDANPHTPEEPKAILRHRGTPWAFRQRNPLLEWVSERYGDFITQRVMAWEGQYGGKMQNLFLGAGVPAVPEGLPSSTASDGARSANDLVMATFDRSHGNPRDTRAKNWSRYSERMNFIVNLFASRQHDPSLFTPPTPADERLLDLDLSDEHLDRLRKVCDEPVDTALRQHFAAEGLEPRAFVRTLIDNERPKNEALYGDAQLPEWVDAKLLCQGRDFLRTHGLEIASALFFASLPYSYTAARGAQVLTRTAELMTGNTARRLAETGQLLMDFMYVDPGHDPLHPGTKGFEAVRGVRLFHAAVRRLILSDPTMHWDADDLGQPVNQEDLLGTLVVFTIVVIDALDELGVDVRSARGIAERDAYLHYWLVVGHLLGIDYESLRQTQLKPEEPPLTFEELRLVGLAIFRRQTEPSLGGQTLMSSLLDVTARMMPPWMKGYPAAATRGFIGMARADALGVPPAGPARLGFELVRVATRAFTPKGPGLGLAAFSRWSTKTLYRKWIDENAGEYPPWRREAVRNWRL